MRLMLFILVFSLFVACASVPDTEAEVALPCPVRPVLSSREERDCYTGAIGKRLGATTTAAAHCLAPVAGYRFSRNFGRLSAVTDYCEVRPKRWERPTARGAKMKEDSEIIAELREIRSELKHLNERLDHSFAHFDQVTQMRHEEHEKRILALEGTVSKLEKRLVAYSAVISAAVVLAGILVRLL